MKRLSLIFLTIIILLSIIIYSFYPMLYVATGYGAKCLASGIFVAGRNAEDVIKEDLNHSIVGLSSSEIDYENKTVTTTLFGMAEQTAVYREGLGCTLIGDKELDVVKNDQFTIPTSRRIDQKTTAWPMGDLLKDTIFSNVDYDKLEVAIDSAFDLPGKNVKRTAAVVVVYKGQIIGEQYWIQENISETTRLWGWSMNKSIINALYGILAKNQMVDIKEKAEVDSWKSDDRKGITLNDLFHMSSGLDWEEDYTKVSNATVMLYRSPDVYASAIDVPLKYAPGKEWYYSSGTTNILSGLLKKKMKKQEAYLRFPYDSLFNRIGMYSMVMESDVAGTFIGSSYGYASARDWARFGLLYQNQGIWLADTIVNPEWVKYSHTSAPASQGGYGAQFWLNQSAALPDAPKDLYSCNGHRGQWVMIIPSKDLVIVRLGFSREHFDQNRFVKEIVASIH